MLRLPVRSYVAAGDTVSEIVTVGGQRLRCGALAIAAEALGGSDQNQTQNQTQTQNQNDRRRKWVSRGVWVVDGAVFPAGCNQGMLIDANVAIGAPGSEWGGTGGRHLNGGESAPGDGGDIPGDGESLCPDPHEPFRACLERRHGLSPRLAAAVQYALALRDDVHALSGPGFESLARYVASLGRFGPTVGALLSPVYGAFIFIFIIWAISVE